MYVDSAIFNHSFCHYSGILNNWKIIIEAGNKTRRSTSILLIYPITSVTKMYCVKCNFFNFFLIANIYWILSVWVALVPYIFTYLCMYACMYFLPLTAFTHFYPALTHPLPLATIKLFFTWAWCFLFLLDFTYKRNHLSLFDIFHLAWCPRGPFMLS